MPDANKTDITTAETAEASTVAASTTPADGTVADGTAVDSTPEASPDTEVIQAVAPEYFLANSSVGLRCCMEKICHDRGIIDLSDGRVDQLIARWEAFENKRRPISDKAKSTMDNQIVVITRRNEVAILGTVLADIVDIDGSRSRGLAFYDYTTKKIRAVEFEQIRGPLAQFENVELPSASMRADGIAIVKPDTSETLRAYPDFPPVFYAFVTMKPLPPPEPAVPKAYDRGKYVGGVKSEYPTHLFEKTPSHRPKPT